MSNPRVLHIISWLPKPDNPYLGNFCLRHLESVAPYSESILLRVVVEESLDAFSITEEAGAGYRCVVVRIPLSRNKWVARFRLFSAYNRGYSHVCRHHFTPELVHLHVAKNLGVIALYWKIRHRIPYVWSEHATLYLQPEMKKLGFLWKRVANGASCVMPVSRLLADTLKSKGVKAPMKIIYNVLDKAYLSVYPSENPNASCKLLHISTLNSCKNFMGILHVMERLKKQQLPPFELEVVHDFPADAYRQWVEAHQLQDIVRFLGPKGKEELLELYAKAHALVMFSNIETFSCTVMEAVGVGLPVFATATGAIPEMLAEGRGVLLPIADEEALYQALLPFIQHGYREQDHPVEQKKAYARTHFLSDTIGCQIRDVYQQVLSAPNSRYCMFL